MGDIAMRKDVFAMFAGMAMGAMFAHAAGYLWFLGILGGGAIGYLVRMFAEPARVKYAAKRAWQKTIDMRGSLVYNWQLRLANALNIGMIAGGIVGVILGVISLISPDHFFGIQNLLIRYGVYTIASNILTFFLSVLIIYPLNDGMETDGGFNLRLAAINLNSVALHYHAVRLLGIGIARAFIGLSYTPFICRRGWQFLKLFFRFVHTEDLTACGTYGLVGALAIFLFVPNNLWLILFAAGAGALLGAGMRRVVLWKLYTEAV